MEETKNPLEDQLTQSIMIQGALTAMPQLVSMYPHIKSGIDMLEKLVEEKLGDDKMIVISKKNGKLFALVLDKNVPFEINNNFDLSADSDKKPLIKSYEKDQWKEKLMNSVPMQTLKDRFEKSGGDPSAEIKTDGFLSSIMKAAQK